MQVLNTVETTQRLKRHASTTGEGGDCYDCPLRELQGNLNYTDATRPTVKKQIYYS